MAEATIPSTARLALRSVVGLAILVLGVAAADRWSPGWSDEAPPAAELGVDVGDWLAGVGIELDDGSVLARRLSTPQLAYQSTWKTLGGGAPEWLRREGRGLVFSLRGPAQWGEVDGTAVVGLSAWGRPVRFEWIPGEVGALLDLEAPRVPVGSVAPIFVGEGEMLGDREVVWGGGRGARILAWPVVGTDEAVVAFDLPNQQLVVERRLGDPALALAELGSSVGEVSSSVLTELLPRLAVVGLFFWAAYRQRLDLVNGGLLAGLVTAVGLVPVVGTTGPVLWIWAMGALGTGVWVFLCWCVADSWLRSTEPEFSTSLDALLRGVVGPRGGSAVVTGLAFGAGLAGAVLAASGVVSRFGWSMPLEAFPLLPMVGSPNPLASGIEWLAAGVIVRSLLLNFVPARVALGLAALVAGAVVAPVPMADPTARVALGASFALALLLGLRRWGLTAALVGAVGVVAWPGLVQALRYRDWLGSSSWTFGGALLGLLVVAVVGRRRSESVDREARGVPRFVRRLETERRLQYEMDLLARMQTGLLPGVLPLVPGYEITARSIIASEAGGDLYDFLRDEEGALWVVAGDVSGHGYSCAIAQATVKAALVSVVDARARPGEVLARVDHVLRATISERMFVTLCLVRLDPENGRCLVANGGHPFPLIAREGEVEEVVVPGLPLGQGPVRTYGETEVTLAAGDVMLLYSDGLVEAQAQDESVFGFDRPARVLAQAGRWNSAEILDRLLMEWRRFLGGIEADDDTTLVVLRRLPTGRSRSHRDDW